MSSSNSRNLRTARIITSAELLFPVYAIEPRDCKRVRLLFTRGWSGLPLETQRAFKHAVLKALSDRAPSLEAELRLLTANAVRSHPGLQHRVLETLGSLYQNQAVHRLLEFSSKTEEFPLGELRAFLLELNFIFQKKRDRQALSAVSATSSKNSLYPRCAVFWFELGPKAVRAKPFRHVRRGREYEQFVWALPRWGTRTHVCAIPVDNTKMVPQNLLESRKTPTHFLIKVLDSRIKNYNTSVVDSSQVDFDSGYDSGYESDTEDEPDRPKKQRVVSKLVDSANSKSSKLESKFNSEFHLLPTSGLS